MIYNKEILLQLPLEERKALASALEDSILAEESNNILDWRKKLIKERIQADIENPENGTSWSELRKKYLG